MPDTELSKDDPVDWVELNRRYSMIWPNISSMRDEPYPGAHDNNRVHNPDVSDKLSELSEAPGEGNQ